MGRKSSGFDELIPLALVLLLFFAYGCTKEDENDIINSALQQGIHNQIKNVTGFDVNTSGLNFTPLIQAADNGSGGSSGECRFDSDCPSLCEGNVFWKRGCDPQADKCVKTFDYDCSAQSTAVGDFSFQKICAPSGCADDTASIHAKKEDLISQANQYSAAMQQTNALRSIASKNCRSALSDVTNRLIVETAISMASPTSTVTGLWSDTTKQAVETLGTANSQTMSAEEYISLNCNAVNSLTSDFNLISKKRDLVMSQAEAFQGQ